MSDSNIRVICRFRPISEQERKNINSKVQHNISVEILDNYTVSARTPTIPEPLIFTYDRVFNESASQAQIYEETAFDTMNDIYCGYNGTIFAYGQTGSGKTYTMMGDEDDLGIIPRSCMHLFDKISADKEIVDYQINCSFLEIYKETLRDLLVPKFGAVVPLKICETTGKGVCIEGLKEIPAKSKEEILDLINIGNKAKIVDSTYMNAASSRSHTLFILTLTQKYADGSSKTSKLNLADLAGSEKVGKTGASGDTLEEAKKINQSLSALGNCILKLSKSKKHHIPYRDSKLTFILKDSLGGNTKTTIFINCSPHLSNLDETISTLRFGQRVKVIKNKVKINKRLSVEELESLISKLQKEIIWLQYYNKVLETEINNHAPQWSSNELRERVTNELKTKINLFNNYSVRESPDGNFSLVKSLKTVAVNENPINETSIIPSKNFNNMNEKMDSMKSYIPENITRDFNNNNNNSNKKSVFGSSISSSPLKNGDGTSIGSEESLSEESDTTQAADDFDLLKKTLNCDVRLGIENYEKLTDFKLQDTLDDLFLMEDSSKITPLTDENELKMVKKNNNKHTDECEQQINSQIESESMIQRIPESQGPQEKSNETEISNHEKELDGMTGSKENHEIENQSNQRKSIIQEREKGINVQNTHILTKHAEIDKKDTETQKQRIAIKLKKAITKRNDKLRFQNIDKINCEYQFESIGYKNEIESKLESLRKQIIDKDKILLIYETNSKNLLDLVDKISRKNEQLLDEINIINTKNARLDTDPKWERNSVQNTECELIENILESSVKSLEQKKTELDSIKVKLKLIQEELEKHEFESKFTKSELGNSISILESVESEFRIANNTIKILSEELESKYIEMDNLETDLGLQIAELNLKNSDMLEELRKTNEFEKEKTELEILITKLEKKKNELGAREEGFIVTQSQLYSKINTLEENLKKSDAEKIKIEQILEKERRQYKGMHRARNPTTASHLTKFCEFNSTSTTPIKDSPNKKPAAISNFLSPFSNLIAINRTQPIIKGTSILSLGVLNEENGREGYLNLKYWIDSHDDPEPSLVDWKFLWCKIIDSSGTFKIFDTDQTKELYQINIAFTQIFQILGDSDFEGQLTDFCIVLLNKANISPPFEILICFDSKAAFESWFSLLIDKGAEKIELGQRKLKLMNHKKQTSLDLNPYHHPMTIKPQNQSITIGSVFAQKPNIEESYIKPRSLFSLFNSKKTS